MPDESQGDVRLGAKALLRAWTALRQARFRRHARYVTETGDPSITTFLEKGIAFAAAGRGRVAHWADGSGLRAAVAFWWESESWYQAPCQVGALDLRLDDPDAWAWVGARFAQWGDELGDAFDLTLDAAYAPLLDTLRPLGFGVDSVQLVGAPELGLARLEPTVEDPEPWRRHGLSRVELAPEHVAEVVALKTAVFRDQPQYCWFYSNPGFADVDAASIRDGIGRAPAYVLVDGGGAVRAYFGASIDADNAFWGVVAGMDLAFGPNVRGRGLLRAAYRVLLSDLVARGVRVFKGGTSQAPVMHVGRELGRDVLAWTVRRGVTFEPAHWRLVGSEWPA